MNKSLESRLWLLAVGCWLLALFFGQKLAAKSQERINKLSEGAYGSWLLAGIGFSAKS
jgi:hypothetical protein